MATYMEMVDMFKDWSNRQVGATSNDGVITYKQVKTFFEFALDNAYRKLRIAPMEYTFPYNAAGEEFAGTNALQIPGDMIEFIQLRKKSTRSETKYDVYGAREDIRSFYQEFDQKGDDWFTFTRERGFLHVYPDIQTGDEFELYYYRRLPDFDARFSAVAANVADNDDFDADVATLQTGNLLYYFAGTDRAAAVSALQAELGDDVFDYDPGLEDKIIQISGDAVSDNFPAGFYLGKETAHWFRDENEKVMLYGALAEAFDYLDEPDQSVKWMNKFEREIEMLNYEEKQRMTRGGVNQVRYQSFLI